MISSIEVLAQVIDRLFPESPPAPLRIARAVCLVRSGELSARDAARLARTTMSRIERLALSSDPLTALLDDDVPLASPETTPVRNMLGQLVIGRLAEHAFEDLYRVNLGTTELELLDDRTRRGDTDYLVRNGSGRQVFRINIKFHGALFNRAPELVGLEPEDCFALATYKIYSALKKQESELLPYIFLVVGVRGLTGGVVGAAVPDDLVHLNVMARASKRLGGVRQIEDLTVERLILNPDPFGFRDDLDSYYQQIRSARWFVLSARKADKLLRELLFDRAFALRVRAFARNYRQAELDMHFSLAQDLTPLEGFFQVLRESGMPGLVTRLERGTI